MNAVYRLHLCNSKRALIEVVPDGRPGLYRVRWPDLGLSDAVNLSRACDAARRWAERQAMTDGRNLSVAQRLKSLANFSWSSSPIAPNKRPARGVAAPLPKTNPRPADTCWIQEVQR
jgi:hypothetical protein